MFIVSNMKHMFQKRNDMEIVLGLLKGESHLRGLFKSIGIPLATLKRSADTLVDANILDVRRMGKNRIFSLKKSLEAREYVLLAEHYKVLKAIDKYPKLIQIIEEARNNCKGMIILFGSHANFTAKKDSDVDLYCLGGKVNGASVKTGEFKLDSLLVKEIIRNHLLIRGVEEYYERIRFFEKGG
jgi:predicted nucleotidyltransferase